MDIPMRIGQNSFIRRCCTRMGAVTDAPNEFLLGATLSLTAAIVGKRVTLGYAGRALPPCLWIVLVGRSSRLRKTTTLELVRQLFLQSPAHQVVKCLPASCTYEAYFDAMCATEAEIARIGQERCSTGWMVCNEFGAFLQNTKKRYNDGFTETLTDVFDVPERLTRHTRTSG